MQKITRYDYNLTIMKSPKPATAGTEMNYFFPVLGYCLLISRGPAKFLGAQFYFSVNEKEKSKHSDINE
jgi:hypothetical protein